MTFHDGVSFSKNGTFTGGGADGSIILFGDIETAFAENDGTGDGVDALSPFLTRHLVSAGGDTISIHILFSSSNLINNK